MRITNIRLADLLPNSCSSTMIGAGQTGRHVFLMELDPLYCDVIVQRFEEFTGKNAERVTVSAAGPAEAGSADA